MCVWEGLPSTSVGVGWGAWHLSSALTDRLGSQQVWGQVALQQALQGQQEGHRLEGGEDLGLQAYWMP